VEASITFKASQKDNPEICEALHAFQIALRSSLKSRKLRLLFVKSETGYMRCYVFAIEDEATRLFHVEQIEIISKRLSYEYPK